MNNTSQDRPDDHDDSETWLMRLRNARTVQPNAENEEIRAMYQAIIKYHQQQEAELLKDVQSDDHAWQQMRFRLKKEGLLKTSNPWKTWVPMAMAAGLLAAVALPSLMAPGVDVLDTQPATLRGNGQTFVVKEPLDVAQGIAKELKTLDTNLKLYWHSGQATIDTDLKAADLDRAEAIVRSKIPAGKDVRLQLGFNRLTFTSAP